ncbi:MAG TPA: HD domain-containing protein [Gemmatimonadaceae bacterium]|nr:HD domain-containing protein [Gemmatimonadaceae bacterium]
MSGAASIELPSWARVSPPRAKHIARVVQLLAEWALAMRVKPAERDAWHDAGRWHDALRDATAAELRHIVPGATEPVALLHGPAAAVMLERAGEHRADVLQAVRWHTVGCADWARTGRALYMADYLEPGRTFDRAARASLAARVPDDFDGVFRQVVQRRAERAKRDGRPLHPKTAALWRAVVEGAGR